MHRFLRLRQGSQACAVCLRLRGSPDESDWTNLTMAGPTCLCFCRRPGFPHERAHRELSVRQRVMGRPGSSISSILAGGLTKARVTISPGPVVVACCLSERVVGWVISPGPSWLRAGLCCANEIDSMGSAQLYSAMPCSRSCDATDSRHSGTLSPLRHLRPLCNVSSNTPPPPPPSVRTCLLAA